MSTFRKFVFVRVAIGLLESRGHRYSLFVGIGVGSGIRILEGEGDQVQCSEAIRNFGTKGRLDFGRFTSRTIYEMMVQGGAKALGVMFVHIPARSHKKKFFSGDIFKQLVLRGTLP
ncbi:hypothetical protein F5Y13DRAFT_40156 [Hypoxylon sp. FL1857]|nr:hypothetical protein F5Y13DRAFT_40156 [Hypoxylon sp. FL1857]